MLTVVPFAAPKILFFILLVLLICILFNTEGAEDTETISIFRRDDKRDRNPGKP